MRAASCSAVFRTRKVDEAEDDDRERDKAEQTNFAGNVAGCRGCSRSPFPPCNLRRVLR